MAERMSDERRSWENFRENGLLWWVNRGLHLFGWAIVLETDEDGTVTDAYPARVPYRGFETDIELDGFRALTHHVARTAAELVCEVDESLLARQLAQRLKEAREAMREARQLCMDSPSREAIIERLDRALKDDAERSGVR